VPFVARLQVDDLEHSLCVLSKKDVIGNLDLNHWHATALARCRAKASAWFRVMSLELSLTHCGAGAVCLCSHSLDKSLASLGPLLEH
jgi:hypothetical protein